MSEHRCWNCEYWELWKPEDYPNGECLLPEHEVSQTTGATGSCVKFKPIEANAALFASVRQKGESAQ